MGISIKQLAIMLSLSESIKGKDVLSLGVQFPPRWDLIVAFSRQYPKLLSRPALELLSKATQSSFQRVFFEHIIGARKIHAIDISKDEGAEYVLNLNEDIEKSDDAELVSTLGSAFDFIFEGGTIEHASDTSTYLKNVFFLLKPSGIYCSNIPATGSFEHGFFQFSPTFIADICLVNSPSLQLIGLFVDDWSLRLKSFSLNSFYRGHRMEFPPLLASKDSANFYRKEYLATSIATGTLLSLVNRVNHPFGIISIIKKESDFEFRMNVVQSVYRDYSLVSVGGSADAPATQMPTTKLSFKSFFLGIPISAKFRFRILTFILTIMGDRVPKKQYSGAEK